MKVVTHKCPNCNANLKLKPGATEGVCEYCRASFTIDDEVIRVEHTGSVEIKDDNDLEIAIATLENFKDYPKSQILFENLIHRYGHKKDIYIYLIRSITHDFKKQTFSLYTLNEINDYWAKFKSLAKTKDIALYEESINTINKNYWYKELIESTANFNYKKSNTSVKKIEYNWENYTKYCTKGEKETLEIKYNDFLKREKDEVSQKKRMIKITLFAVIILLIVIFLIDFISLYTEKAKQKVQEVKATELDKNCKSLMTCQNPNFLKEYFNDTKSNLTIDNVSIEKENKLLKVTVKLDNRYKTSQKTYEFKINDDMGPFISSTNCTYKDTETVEVKTCFEIFDFADGAITNDKAEIKYDENIFKSEGTKQITVSVSDKDGQTSTKQIDVNITKTPIILEVKLSKELTVDNTAKLIYNFNPNNIPNKEVEITYDENYVSIDKDNNVKGLKKGNTDICVISKYDGTKQCTNVDIGLICKNTYTFDFSGGNKETRTAGETFCTGTYKVYASVLNKKEFYGISINRKNEFSGTRLTIYKDSSFLNDEGTKHVFEEGTSFTADSGITQVKLVKVS